MRGRILLKLKFNLAIEAPGKAFSIEQGRLLWHTGTIDIDADEVLKSNRDANDENAPTRIDEAMTFLRQALSKGAQRTPTPANQGQTQAPCLADALDRRQDRPQDRRFRSSL